MADPAVLPRRHTAAAGRIGDVAAVLVIAQRDVTKFLSDRPRMIATFVLPFLLVVILGNSFGGIDSDLGFDYLTFVFTGVFAQALFQSAAGGLVSLVDDRDNDFTQELFVAPVSRYAIVLGKIAGEALVAMVQAVGIVGFGVVAGVRLPLASLPGLVAVGLLVCLSGGAFGLLLLASVRSRRLAEQIFNFVLLPQFFLAGVFNPISDLPLYLDVLSRLAPLRYAVDLTRSVFYLGRPDRAEVVLDNVAATLAVVVTLFTVCLVVGTMLFVRNERNR